MGVVGGPGWRLGGEVGGGVRGGLGRGRGGEGRGGVAGDPGGGVGRVVRGVGGRGGLGVVELADRAWRDYTTFSRQVAKLEELVLAQRQKNARDKRINEAVITAAGKAMTDKIDAARTQIYQQLFAGWPAEERAELTRLLQRFVGDFMAVDRQPQLD